MKRAFTGSMIALLILAIFTSGYCFGRAHGDKTVNAFAEDDAPITIDEAIEASRSAGANHILIAELVRTNELDADVMGGVDFQTYWANLHFTVADMLEGIR